MDGNKLFNKIASEILANPLTSPDQQIKLGDRLCNSFVKKLIIQFKDLEEVETKFVKVFYKNKRNILSIETQIVAIKITINAKKGEIEDGKNILRDVSNIGHWGNGDYQIKLENEEAFNDVLQLISQIY